MFSAQRLQKIREIIIDNEYMDVPKLSSIIGVSEVTIRRDLDKLQTEGLITKTYGGVMLNKDFSKKDNNEKIEAENKAEINKNYDLISGIAVDMINGNEAIFLSGGLICRNIAKKIKNVKDLLVITNDIFVASELYNNQDVKLVVTGGNLLHNTGTLVGNYAMKTLESSFVNKAFIEVDGAHLKFGFSVKNYEVLEITKKLTEISNETIALIEHKSFNQTSFTKLGKLEMFKKVISNMDIDEEYKDYFYTHNVKLYTSYEIK